MNYPRKDINSRTPSRNILFFATALFCAATFSGLALYFDLKILLAVTAVSLLPAIYFAFRYFKPGPPGPAAEKTIANSKNGADEKIFTPEIEEKLLALEQIGEFFGSALKPADMFRLIASRAGEIVPFDGCFLFLMNPTANIVKIAHCAAEDPARFNGLLFEAGQGLAGKSITQGTALSDRGLSFDEKLFPQHFKSGIAAPLSDQNGILGSLALGSVKPEAYSRNELILLQAVSERISDLIGKAFNNQRNSSNALTDMLTNLPNEAAFYLILEQQIAEAQRFSQKNALTVLCMDIKEFSRINHEHGHAIGDELLTFTSRIIKNQLRQMDFLAHPSADEFWAILPGASSNIVELVIERLDRAFSHSRFTSVSNVTVEIELHFGTATFKKDGETALQLVQTALRNKSAEKFSAAPGLSSVIPFPLRNQQITNNPF